MNRRSVSLFSLALLLACSCACVSTTPTTNQAATQATATPAAQAASFPAELKPALDSITSDDILKHIKTLSSDEFEGRGPGTHGEELSVNYITEQFKRLGLKPGNPDGTYVQKVPLMGFRAEPQLSISAGGKQLSYNFPDDYVAVSRHFEPEVDVQDSDLVFVGYGNSTLDDLAQAAAAAQGRTVAPDPEPEKGSFYRSDHFEFAKQGVPALDPDSGVDYVGKPPGYGKQKRDYYTEHDYHNVTDEVKPDWDLSGAVEDAQLLFVVGYNVAQGDKYPEWKPGTEFKAKRDAMLKGAGGSL